MKTFEINDEIEQAFRQGREIGYRQGIEACKAQGFGIYRPNRNTLTIKGKLSSLVVTLIAVIIAALIKGSVETIRRKDNK